MRTLSLSLLLFTLAACEPPLPQPDPTSDGGDTGELTADGGVPRITTRVEGDVSVSLVNAMGDDTFAALDLDTGAEVPFVDAAWDLAFQRFHVRTRGGVNGSGGVKVAPLEGADFDAVTVAPVDGWLEDQPDGEEDENKDPDTVFETASPWYTYSTTTHVLSPTGTIYAVRSDLGAYFKVRLEGYYDSAGTPGNITVRWAPIAAP